jgi:hypothetical protein
LRDKRFAAQKPNVFNERETEIIVREK